jgi:hypothetical protein
MDFSSLGIKGVSAAADIIEPSLKIALIGDPGVGKSWLACSIASADNEVMNLDFDGRAASLQGKPHVFVKTYHDANPNIPKAMQEFETDLAALKYAKSAGKSIPSTYVIDSVSYARKATESELIRQESKLGRVVRVGTTQLKISAGWDIINANRLYLEYIINELSTLGNVIAIFHEREEKDVIKTTKEEVKYTGLVTIQPQYLNTITSIFNDTWRLKINYANKRVLQTGISNEFAGKCSLRGVDAEEVEPNILKLLEKHKKWHKENSKPSQSIG